MVTNHKTITSKKLVPKALDKKNKINYITPTFKIINLKLKNYRTGSNINANKHID